MFEMFHPFKGFIISLYIVIASSIMISRYDPALIFIRTYFQSSLYYQLLKLISMYTSAQ